MLGLVGIFLIIINLIICRKNAWLGILWFLLISLASPEIKLGSWSISYNILAFFPVVFYYILKRGTLFIPHLLLFPILFGGQIIISTLCSCIIDGYSPNIIGLFGIFRFVIVLICLSDIQMLNKDAILKGFFFLTLINFLTSIIQITIPDSVSFFYDLYWKPSMTPLQNALELGKFTRAVGTFATPTILGAFSLITFAMFYFEMRYNKFSYFNICGVIMSIICGLLALSKIFIIGLPVLLLTGILIALFQYRPHLRLNLRLVLLIGLVVFLGYIIALKLENEGIPVMWYLNYVFQPSEALDTRYSADTGGNLIELKNAILNNLIIGVGEIKNKNIFIGDSSIFIILYNTGVIGFFYLSVYWIMLLWENLKMKKKSYSHFFVLVALLLGFIGANMYASPLGILACTYSFISVKDKTNTIIIHVKKE